MPLNRDEQAIARRVALTPEEMAADQSFDASPGNREELQREMSRGDLAPGAMKLLEEQHQNLPPEVTSTSAKSAPGKFDLDGARKAGYDDAEIASFLAPQFNFDLIGAQRAGYTPTEIVNHLSPPPPDHGEFMKGLIGGTIGGNPKMFGSAMQGAGTIFDSDWLKQQGTHLAKLGEENLSDYSPAVPSIANVRTEKLGQALGDFFTKYLPYQAGNALASMAPTIASGLLGAVAGTAVAGPPGAVVGGFGGTLLTGYPMNYGDIYSDAMDDKGIQQAIRDGTLTDKDVARITAIAAVPITALDSWSMGRLGSALTSPIKTAIYHRIFQEMKAGGLREGTTEGLQQIISEAVQHGLGSDKTLSEHAVAVADNAIGGMAGGVLTGGAAGAVQRPSAMPKTGTEMPNMGTTAVDNAINALDQAPNADAAVAAAAAAVEAPLAPDEKIAAFVQAEQDAQTQRQADEEAAYRQRDERIASLNRQIEMLGRREAEQIAEGKAQAEIAATESAQADARDQVRGLVASNLQTAPDTAMARALAGAAGVNPDEAFAARGRDMLSRMEAWQAKQSAVEPQQPAAATALSDEEIARQMTASIPENFTPAAPLPAATPAVTIMGATPDKLTTPELRISAEAAAKPEQRQAATVELDRRAQAYKQRGMLLPENDSLFTAIAKLGGLNKQDVVSSWGVDPADVKGLTPIFGKPLLRTTGGLSIDGMAELLVQHGYLDQRDLQEFERKFDQELRGKPVLTPAGYDRQAQAVSEASNEHVASLELTPAKLEAAGYDKLAAAEQEQVQAILDGLVEYARGKPYEALIDEIIERAIQQTEGRPYKEYAHAVIAQIKEVIKNAESANNQSAQAVSGARGESDQGAGEGTREDGRPAAEPVRQVAGAELALTGQTAAEVKAAGAAAQREAAAKKQREVAPPPEEFTLAGSNRQADQATAHGQQELAPVTSNLPAERQQLFVEYGNQRAEVSSLEEASKKWGQFRQTVATEHGVGASAIGSGARIVDQNGKEVGRISYNGKVWPPGEWHSGMKPLVGENFKPSTPKILGATPSNAQNNRQIAGERQNVGTSSEMATERPYRDTQTKALQHLARETEDDAVLKAVEDELNTRAEEHARVREERLAKGRAEKAKPKEPSVLPESLRVKPANLKEETEAANAVEAALKEKGIKFSKAFTRLSVLHNLSAENLKFADQLGGLPVPSLGVVPEGMGISGMGDITLIGRKDLANPAEVPVHDADVYSPTFPRSEYDKVPSRVAQVMVDRLKPFADKFEDHNAIQSTWDDAVNQAKPQEIISAWMRGPAAKAMFLKERGVDVQPIMRKKRVAFPWVKYLDWDKFREVMPFNDERSMEVRERATTEVKPIISAAIDKYLDQPGDGKKLADLAGHKEARAMVASSFGLKGDWINNGDPMPYTLYWKLTESKRDFGKIEVDGTKTGDRLERALKGREVEFKQWVDDTVMGMFGRPFIRLDGRKVPYTLSNIVDAMTGPVRAREASLTYGEGKARAAAAKRFSDLEQMRRASENIADESTLKESRDAAKKLMEAYRNEVVRYYGTGASGSAEFGRVWDGLDASMKAMARWAKGAKTEDNMRRALSAEGFRVANMHESIFEDAVQAGMAWLKAPVPYFEAKPQRSVSLNEFAGAVIPRKSPSYVMEILDRNKIPYREYSTGGKNQREAQQQATDAFRKVLAKQGENVLFSRNRNRSTIPTQPDETYRAQTDQAEAILKDAGYSFKITPVALPDRAADGDGARVNDQSAGRRDSFALAQRISGLFGKTVIPVTAEGDFAFDGFVMPGSPLSKYVFIDASADKPAHVILGHELSHHMEKDAPAVYRDLVTALEPLIFDVQGYQELHGMEAKSEDYAVREIVGDLLGNNFGDQKFWAEVAKRSTAFGKIVATIRQWLSDLTAKLKGMTGFRVEQFVSDVEDARKVLAQATVDYLRNRGNGVGGYEAKFSSAWHGSAHDFDRFSTEHIGSGEGAQAYGWGLYFTDRKGIAEHYRNQLGTVTRGHNTYDSKKITPGFLNQLRDSVRNGDLHLTDEEKTLQSFFDSTRISPSGMQNLDSEIKEKIDFQEEQAKRHRQREAEAKQRGPEVVYASHSAEDYADMAAGYEKKAAELKAVAQHLKYVPEKRNGKLYQVNLAPAEDEYLLWDKPLSEQSEKIKAAFETQFERQGKVLETKSAVGKTIADAVLNDDTGSALHAALMNTFMGPKGTYTGVDEQVSRYLSSIGIPGIKYLDNVSRGAGEGTYNYVLFDDKLVKVEAKFSRPIADSKTTGDYKDTFAAKATDFMTNYFTSFDKIGWWQKTVGTPFNLALTNKEFAPFYDEGQAYINDISRYGNESADLAQDLLPRVEHFRDVLPAWLGGKTAAQRNDVMAASQALYAGTLWGNGSPMEGRVWTDAELKSGRAMDNGVSIPAFNPMNAKQIALYRQALAATSKSMDELAKSLIQRIARQADVGFDRGMSLEDVATIVGQQLEDKLGAATNASNEALVKELQIAKASVADIADKAKTLNEAGYFPAMRFGKYALHVVRGGKQLYFGMYESKAQALVAEQKLKQEFPGAEIQKGVIPKEKYKLFQGLSLDALEAFSDYIVDAEGNKIAKDALVQGLLKAATAERSVMKRHIHRKGIPGYSEDVPRVLASFVVSSARAIASNYHAAEMLKLAQDIKAGDVSDYAAKLARYMLDPVEEAQGLRGFLFAQYLGGSIASGLVNMTQPFMVTAPWASKYTSYADAVAKLGKAGAENADALTGKIGEAYRRAKREGIVTPQEIHQLRAETGGGLGARSLAMRKLSFAWGSIFSLAEQFNRKSTFLAAYRIAEEMSAENKAKHGITNSYDFAKQAVAETQFTYNKGNRPVFSRGMLGATVMTFKQFSISYLEMAHRLYKTDKKAFALLALTLLAAGGIEGLPFAEDLEDLVDTMGQWLGYATNSKKKVRQWAMTILGPDLSQVALRGVSGLSWMPVDISARMGMANLIPGTAALKPSEKNKTKDVVEMLGPAGQFLPLEGTMMGNALERLGKGDLGGAIKAAAPQAIQAAVKGGEMLETGKATDLKGRKITAVSPGEAVLKMAGLQPASVARESQKIGIVQQDIDLVNRMKSEIAEQWARGIVDKDPAEVRAARDKMARWNDDNNELRIHVNSQAVQQRIKEMRMTREERFVKHAPKETRAGVRAALQ